MLVAPFELLQLYGALGACGLMTRRVACHQAADKWIVRFTREQVRLGHIRAAEEASCAEEHSAR